MQHDWVESQQLLCGTIAQPKKSFYKPDWMQVGSQPRLKQSMARRFWGMQHVSTYH